MHVARSSPFKSQLNVIVPRIHRVHHLKQQSSSSSLADKFWDVVTTGSINPPNPILTDIDRLFPKHVNESDGGDDAPAVPANDSIPPLPNFASLRAHHLPDAARIIQSQYEAAFAEFEEEVQTKLLDASADIDYVDIVPKLDRIASPLHYIKSVRDLMASTNGMDDVLEAAGEVESIITFQHGSSRPIVAALQLLETQLGEDGGDDTTTTKTSLERQRLRVVQHLLRDAEDVGYFLESDETKQTLADLRSDIASAEGELQDLCRLPPQMQRSPIEMVKLMYEILNLKKEWAKMLGYNSYADWCMRSCMASGVDDVKRMHTDIAEKVLPIR